MLCISHNDYPPLINKSAGPPMSLCCVCKSWQKVASGLPMLWTAASVNTNSINQKQRKILPQFLDRWFSRSNELPLAFKFTSGNERHDKVMKTFTACITPFAHRFRHLDVDLFNLSAPLPTQTQLAYPDISWFTLQFPQLESAILRDISKSTVTWKHLFSPLHPPFGGFAWTTFHS